MKRDIQHIQQPIAAQDGAGVKIQRLFPAAGMDHFDPFLLLDHFGSTNPDDFLAGFPMHPHRGIETVTYMLEGRVKHRDSTGREGVIEAGDVQWMSAGRGIMHEEMPERANGRLSGFQLWVNLPASEKMQPARYQEYKASEITDFDYQDNRIRLVSGELFGHSGAVKAISRAPLYADITLEVGRLSLNLPEHHHAFVYIFEGETQVVNEVGDSQAISASNLIVLSDGDELVFNTPERARIMLAAAQKIEEPIARYGPFVMNTQQEIQQTLRELQSGNFPPK